MKKCTLFAVIGCAFKLVSAIYWCIFRFVGYQAMESVNNIVGPIESVCAIVANAFILMFFVTLFKNQK